MKLAIDSYCYHRYFGEVYEGLQSDPGSRMCVWDFLGRARDYRVEGISLECCFLPQVDDELIAALRTALARDQLDVVWAWGHPDGLGSGTRPEAVADLVRHIGFAKRVGASVMRICGGSRRTRPASWPEHKAALVPLLRECVDVAEQNGVVLALENHLDLLADEILELIEAIDSPFLGVCLDTGNNLRLLEDPIDVVTKLAPFTRATHVKDIGAVRGRNPRHYAFWPSVPAGAGLIDLAETMRLLWRANYRGLLAIEIDYLHPSFGSDEEPAVRQSLAYIRDLLAGLGDKENGG